MILRIILILLVPVLSIVFSLMTSGIENIVTANNKNWETIPIYYWLIFWAITWFSIYRFKFGNTKKLKIYILRLIITLRMKFFQLDFVDNNFQLNDMQRKAISIWATLLNDPKTEMSCCMLSNRRMLVKNDITCIITTQTDANCMFISRFGNQAAYYDVWLPNNTIAAMYKSFDKEQMSRFQIRVDAARSAISATISL